MNDVFIDTGNIIIIRIQFEIQFCATAQLQSIVRYQDYKTNLGTFFSYWYSTRSLKKYKSAQAYFF